VNDTILMKFFTDKNKIKQKVKFIQEAAVYRWAPMTTILPA